MQRQIAIGFGALGFLFIGLIVQVCVISSEQSDYLSVTFLNVGQGDAIFIEAPNGVQVLIDGGPDSSVLRELHKVMSFFDKEIDLVIVTHPDADHIAGIPEVLKRFKVDQYITATSSKETAITKVIDDLAVIDFVKEGDIILLDPLNNIYLEVLSPRNDIVASNANDQSVIVRLVFNEIQFMLTGDASKSVENNLVQKYSDNLEAEVLKAGHHGSKTSTDENFLSQVAPKYAVVSAGENNKYGHPNEEVISLLKENQIQILETKNGAIRFQTDGKELFLAK